MNLVTIMDFLKYRITLYTGINKKLSEAGSKDPFACLQFDFGSHYDAKKR